MKIAVVTGDDVVGAEPAQLCAALAGRGNDVISYIRQGSRRPGRAVGAGYRTLSVRVGPTVTRSHVGILPFVGDWAATLQQQWYYEQPDVVHAYGWLGGLAAQLAARKQAWPTVQTFQSLAAGSPTPGDGKHGNDLVRERIERLLARNASWVTVESTSDLDALARVLHRRARLSVLTGGVDVEQYTPVGRARDTGGLHRVLCLAPNPLTDNGFDTAIRVLPRVPGAKLAVAETEPSNRHHDRARAQLKRLATDLGVADRVRFLGTVPDDDLAELLRSADVLACTPRQPPRATAALRAMASGLAVVSLPVGALADVVVTDVTGLVVSSDDADGLAVALRGLAAERFRCDGMGAAGRSRAASRYSWDRIALDSLAIYGKLSSERLLRTQRGGAMEEVAQ